MDAAQPRAAGKVAAGVGDLCMWRKQGNNSYTMHTITAGGPVNNLQASEQAASVGAPRRDGSHGGERKVGSHGGARKAGSRGPAPSKASTPAS